MRGVVEGGCQKGPSAVSGSPSPMPCGGGLGRSRPLFGRPTPSEKRIEIVGMSSLETCPLREQVTCDIDNTNRKLEFRADNGIVHGPEGSHRPFERSSPRHGMKMRGGETSRAGRGPPATGGAQNEAWSGVC